MSIGHKVRIGVEEGGEVKYLTNIQLYKEHEVEMASYETSADGQVLEPTAVADTLKHLHGNHPDTHFVVLPAE